MNKITERDRFRGAMVGTLCGDALGAPYEWKDPDTIRNGFSEQGGLTAFDYLDPWKGKRNVKAGQPTDDSELAAALAQNLVEYRGLKESDLYYRLRDFIHGNTAAGRCSILTEKAYGSGGTLRAALEPAYYDESLAKFTAGEIPTPPSNGSLMRCIGIPLRYFVEHPYKVIDAARRQSRVTHRNDAAVATCAVFSVFVQQILQECEPEKAWDITRKLWCNAPAYEEATNINLTKPDYELEVKGKEGWCILSLRVAVWAGITATDFRDGLTKTVSVGGDTDTYAAIAGGILGARFGYEAIPEEWRSVLQGRQIMETLAGSLYKIAYGH